MYILPLLLSQSFAKYCCYKKSYLFPSDHRGATISGGSAKYIDPIVQGKAAHPGNMGLMRHQMGVPR